MSEWEDKFKEDVEDIAEQILKYLHVCTKNMRWEIHKVEISHLNYKLWFIAHWSGDDILYGIQEIDKYHRDKTREEQILLAVDSIIEWVFRSIRDYFYAKDPYQVLEELEEAREADE